MTQDRAGNQIMVALVRVPGINNDECLLTCTTNTQTRAGLE